MPSVSSIFTVLHNWSNQKQVAENTISFPSVDPFNAFYILDPENQKYDVYDEMEQKYRFLHLKVFYCSNLIRYKLFYLQVR